MELSLNEMNPAIIEGPKNKAEFEPREGPTSLLGGDLAADLDPDVVIGQGAGKRRTVHKIVRILSPWVN